MSEWFYVLEGKQMGPLSEEELEQKIADGALDATVKVWREGLTDWVSLEERASVSSPQVEPAVNEVRLPLAGLPRLQVLSLVACFTCLLNPLAAFALVYSLQAKNAHNDGREEDARTKLKLGNRMVLLAFLLSFFVYGGVFFFMTGALGAR